MDWPSECEKCGCGGWEFRLSLGLVLSSQSDIEQFFKMVERYSNKDMISGISQLSNVHDLKSVVAGDQHFQIDLAQDRIFPSLYASFQHHILPLLTTKASRTAIAAHSLFSASLKTRDRGE